MSDAGQRVATYAYDGLFRRARKVVSHSGVEAVANDGGDTTVHFYYGGVPWASGGVSRWNICETRNGSEQVTRQWVWGTQYVDEPVFMDVNLDPATDDDCDPDTTGTGEDGETDDRRYFYVQDRNRNMMALVESNDGVGTQGRIAERYSYTPYGEFVVLKGQTGSGSLGNVLPVSTVGNVFAHQGLPFDHEKGSYQNRHREYAPQAQCFAQPDFAGTNEHGSRTIANPVVHRVDGEDPACGVKVHNARLPHIHSGYSINGEMHDFGPTDHNPCCLDCKPGKLNYLPGGDQWYGGTPVERKPSPATMPDGTTSCATATCQQITDCLTTQEALWKELPKSQWCLFSNDCVDFVDQNLSTCCLQRPTGWLSAEELAILAGLNAAAVLASYCLSK